MDRKCRKHRKKSSTGTGKTNFGERSPFSLINFRIERFGSSSKPKKLPLLESKSWNEERFVESLDMLEATKLIVCGLSISVVFLRGAIPGLFFFIFVFSIVQLVDKILLIKFCRCLDSNRGSLVSEVTALPTEPQPLTNLLHNLCS